MSRPLHSLCIPAALSLLAGCAASAPGKVETGVMTKVKHWMVGNKSTKNPVTASDENIRAGKEAFGHYCVTCHGLDGQNTGVPFAEKMSPPVASLASPRVQQYTDGQLKQIIDDGIRLTGMPGAKGILNDDEIWSIVLYLRHLPPAGSLGEPQFYSGDPATCASASR